MSFSYSIFRFRRAVKRFVPGRPHLGLDDFDLSPDDFGTLKKDIEVIQKMDKQFNLVMISEKFKARLVWSD